MDSNLASAECSCVIAFYNEGERILNVLKVMTTVKNLSEIICVDDGSNDDTYLQIKKRYPAVQVIRLDENHGKSYAVLQGLQQVKTEFVLLFDGDIFNLYSTEIENAIQILLNNTSIDMLILYRKTEPIFTRFTRGELVFSGERILRTLDLIEVFKSHPKAYQLEIAINLYMNKHNKNVYWLGYSGRDELKEQKTGVLEGFIGDIKMYLNVGAFNGYIPALKDLLFFGRKEYIPSKQYPSS